MVGFDVDGTQTDEELFGQVPKEILEEVLKK